MKKIFAALVFVLMFMPSAFAYQYGGFQDAYSSLVTVKQAQNMPDEAFVTLQGQIERRLTSDEYLFFDKTAKIVVEIDSEKWLGQTVNPNDIIEITGEVDRNFRNVKIDVDFLKVINSNK